MIKKFTGIDGRVAWALTHVDAVVGLKKALRDISSSLGGALEDGSNVSIENMEIGKAYLKDGKIYFRTREAVAGSTENVTIGYVIGGAGVSTIGYDNLLPSGSECYESLPMSWDQILYICQNIKNGDDITFEEMNIFGTYFKEGNIYFKIRNRPDVTTDYGTPIAVTLKNDGIHLTIARKRPDKTWYYTDSVMEWSDLVPRDTSGNVIRLANQNDIPVIETLTQEEYDELDPPDADTIYLITEST